MLKGPRQWRRELRIGVKKIATRLRCGGRVITAAGMLLLFSGCAMARGFLIAPAGPVALAERHEFVTVSIVLIFVLVPVLLLVPLVAWHYRLSNAQAAYRPQWAFSWVLEGLIWIPPTGIVVLLGILLWQNTTRLDPYRPLPGAGTETVDVVALDWKWLFIYPAEHIATVNQLVVPAGQPIRLHLTSGTVMQSLLMPRLAGQIFVMAGMQTQLNFAVQKPGTYMGENTQYNGDGFAEDKFQVNALPDAGFADWVKQAQANPVTLDAPAYQALSRQSVLPAPMLFGDVTPGLYQKILQQQIPPGYLAQHRETSNG